MVEMHWYAVLWHRKRASRQFLVECCCEQHVRAFFRRSYRAKCEDLDVFEVKDEEVAALDYLRVSLH